MHVAVRTEPLACDQCGVTVATTVSAGIATGREHKTREGHDAPCGLRCLGGLVSRGALGLTLSEGDRRKRVDEVTHTSDRCPRCRTAAEIRQARIDRIGLEIRAEVRAQVAYDEAMDAMSSYDETNAVAGDWTPPRDDA